MQIQHMLCHVHRHLKILESRQNRAIVLFATPSVGPPFSTHADLFLKRPVHDILFSSLLGAGSIWVHISGAPPIVHDPLPSSPEVAVTVPQIWEPTCADFTVGVIRRGTGGLPAGQGEAMLTEDVNAPCSFQQLMCTAL